MQSSRGFSLLELLVMCGLIRASSQRFPSRTQSGSAGRNSVWTASEQIGSQIRQARLKAITRNQNFRVAFDCPGVGQYRVLAVQEDPAIDDGPDRCNESYEFRTAGCSRCR